jgi:hypothetical protein
VYWAARWALRCREDSLADAEQAIEMAGGGFVKAHFRKTAALLSLGRFLEAVAAGEMALAAAGGGEPQQIVGLVEQARKRGAEHKEEEPIEMLLLKAAEQVDVDIDELLKSQLLHAALLLSGMALHPLLR